MSDRPPDHVSPPPADAAIRDPARAGAGEVRWKDVAVGFGIAFAVMFGTRFAIWLPFLFAYPNGYEPLVAGLVIWYVPIPVLLFLIWRNARRGRKGRAIGMAIYAGIAALLITACWTAVAAG